VSPSEDGDVNQSSLLAADPLAVLRRCTGADHTTEADS
jgi:hypothetical protein